MVVGDLHIHSCYSNNRFKNFPPWVASTPKEILLKAKKVGLRVVSITDHDTLEGSKKALKYAEELKIIVIPGCEITSKDGHILAYGIKEEIPKGLSAEKTIDIIHKQQGVAVLAHPFRSRFNIERRKKTKEIFKLSFDGFEVANASVSVEENKKIKEAIKTKEKNFLIETGGSDSHVLEFIGWGRTIFERDVSTSEEAIFALKRGEIKAEVAKYVPEIWKFLTVLKDQFKFLFRLPLLPFQDR